MNQRPQSASQSDTKQQVTSKISVKKKRQSIRRVYQGDIFEDIEIIENIIYDQSIIEVKKIIFPFVVCLNQECDLERDFENTSSEACDNNFLHIAIAPAFIFEQFLNGNHWGRIFSNNKPKKRKDTAIKKIINNETPRYHYLKFSDQDMPELIIDFKHFFTINRDRLYEQIDNRLCSLAPLFKEKINQRFSYYISRIGLPIKD